MFLSIGVNLKTAWYTLLHITRIVNLNFISENIFNNYKENYNFLIYHNEHFVFTSFTLVDSMKSINFIEKITYHLSELVSSVPF